MAGDLKILKLAEDKAPALQHIQLAAGRRFRDCGMLDVAGAPPTSTQIFEDAARAGFLWGAFLSEQLGGFILCNRFEGYFLIEQLSVLPDYAGRRIGCHLVEAARIAADAIGCDRLILSTFRHVPWNAPYYQRMGFEMMEAVAFPDFIHRLRSEEALALDMADRVIMWRSATKPIT